MAAKKSRCELCGRPRTDVLPVTTLPHALAAAIQPKLGRKSPTGAVCRECVNRERIAHTVSRLAEERGELSELERQIAAQAASHASVARNLDREFERNKTLGDRIADRVAQIGGS